MLAIGALDVSLNPAPARQRAGIKAGIGTKLPERQKAWPDRTMKSRKGLHSTPTGAMPHTAGILYRLVFVGIERKAKAGDNLTNQYDLRGLVKAAATFAEQKIAIRERRAAEDKSRRATPAAFALIEGGQEGLNFAA